MDIKAETRAMLKRRIPVDHKWCTKRQEKDRAKYGSSCCDSYSFNYSVGLILANNLFQYIADAKNCIVREDWDVIEKHAQAIIEYAQADAWDIFSSDIEEQMEFLEKETAWREAMHWLTENWNNLWY